MRLAPLLAFVALLACHPPRSPALRRAATTALHPVDGVLISVATNDWLAWTMIITNESDESIAIVWDESSFVTGSGQSWGRLIPGSTRRIDVPAPHPPAPLAPHASMNETVLPELELQGGVDPYAMSPQQMNGSRMIVVVQTATGRQSWQATLTTY